MSFVTAEDLAKALEDLLYSVPPRNAYESELIAFDEARASAKGILEEWEAQNG